MSFGVTVNTVNVLGPRSLSGIVWTASGRCLGRDRLDSDFDFNPRFGFALGLGVGFALDFGFGLGLNCFAIGRLGIDFTFSPAEL